MCMLTNQDCEQVKILKQLYHQICNRPGIVVYNSETSSVALLELTCPLDSEHHIEAARSRKQNKTEYLQNLIT